MSGYLIDKDSFNWEEIPDNIMRTFVPLWTNNDDPLSDFAGQTLTVPGLSAYDLFLIVCRDADRTHAVTKLVFCELNAVFSDFSICDSYVDYAGSDSAFVAQSRNGYIRRDTNAVNFSDCAVLAILRDGFEPAQVNSKLIPIAIYGTKNNA